MRHSTLLLAAFLSINIELDLTPLLMRLAHGGSAPADDLRISGVAVAIPVAPPDQFGFVVVRLPVVQP
jgi:hypothetical protein